MRVRLAAVAAGAALLACARGGTDDAAPRLRLWTLAAAELVEAPPPPAPRAVPVPGFEAGAESWREITLPGVEPVAPEVRFESEDGRTFLRLTGIQGGLHTVVPVEPDTCYVFSGSVRAESLDQAPPDAATFWIGEASGPATFEELFTTHRELSMAGASLPGAPGGSGWRALRRVFVTTPRTRFLHVACSLAARPLAGPARIDFADVSLEETTPDFQWRTVLAEETARRAAVDPPEADWQRKRRVSARLGGEHRPALVLLPGERLRFALPHAGVRFTAGYGAWAPARLQGRTGHTKLVVRLGPWTLTPDAVASADAAAGSWAPAELSFDPEATTLELACEGDVPLVIGAPMIHTDAPRPPGPSVLLISIDTLRADHVGAYGYALETTPTLDRLARSGVLCRDASAQSPYTLPSHATLLTGQFPSVHGVVSHGRTLAASRSASLAETLASAGFTTQAFTAGGFVNADFGLDRGFEGFGVIDPIRARDSHYFRNLAREHGPETASRLLDEHGFAGVERWLEAHRDERFFLFLHTYAVHDYDPPERYLACDELGCPRPQVPLRTRTAAEAAAFTPEMRAHVVHLYDAALRFTDERLGALVARLEALGLAKDTLIAVTSDHGEEFFEHGSLQHGRTLYEELLAIPLLFSGPGFDEARVIERPAMLVDVAPTLLARLGLPRDARMQGVDLLGERWPARAVWSEVDDRFAHKYALREEDGRKTIHGPEAARVMFPNERVWEQYDLARDPREAQDLAGRGAAPEELERARALLERQRSALEELGNSLGEVGRGSVDERTLEELDELGDGGE